MLAQKRREKGLSQSQLADITGISLRTLQAYESETRNINKAAAENVYLLAQALDTSMEEILCTERIRKK
jgi:transcriptional regulator with XRE-family HTH domain